MRLKDVVELVNEKTDRVDRPYVALENIVSWDAKFVASNATTEGTNACFKAGDVLFGKLRPYLAKGYLPDYDGICSTEFLVMRPYRGINGRYILYWMLSPDFINVIKNHVAGVKMPRTDWATVSQMELTLPSLDLQRKIVAYLDEKTAAIDARVAVLEKKLAAYKRLKASVINRAVTRGLDPKAKLKNSGVDWIGKVPVGWEVGRIGSLYDQRSTKVSDKDYLPLSVSKQGIVPQMESVAKTGNGDDRKLVKAGDFVINSRSDRRGACGIADRNGSVSVINIVLTPRIEMNPQYYNWLFHTTMFGDEFYNMGNGIVDDLWSTRWSDMKSISIVVPPLPEQRAIADYLDAECAKIDKMAELVTREIELYKKLKRSLINEVVTEKREVA